LARIFFKKKGPLVPNVGIGNINVIWVKGFNEVSLLDKCGIDKYIR
jgi:hypothetical protein